jgi:hypothetical protein
MEINDLLMDGWVPYKTFCLPLKTVLQQYKDGILERIPYNRGYLYRVRESYSKEADYELSAKYFFDRPNDRYIFNLPSRKKALAVPGGIVRAMVAAYTDADGSPSSWNQLADRFGLRRQTVIELLKSLEVTKTSAPWTREHITATDEDELHEDLIRMKSERVRSKAEQETWRKEKQDADKWRRFELAVQEPMQIMPNLLPVKLPKRPKVRKRTPPYLAVLIPFDLHIDKLCARTGVDRARERLVAGTNQIIDYITSFGHPQQWLTSSGGDWFNSDNFNLTTTKGTPQKHAKGFATMAKEGCQLKVDLLEMLRSVAPVTYLSVAGNHDQSLEVVSGFWLAGQYQKAKDVTIVCDSKEIHAVEYGQNLIGVHHGERKPKNMIAKLSDQFASSWGRCPHRHLYSGHFHEETRVNHAGTTADTVGSLSVKDSWEDSMAFTGLPLLSVYLHCPNKGRFAQFDVKIFDDSSKPEPARLILP